MANEEQTELAQLVNKREELRGTIRELEENLSDVEQVLEHPELSQEERPELEQAFFRGLQAHREFSKNIDLYTVAIDELDERIRAALNKKTRGLAFNALMLALLIIALACFLDDLPEFLNETARFLRHVGF